jgi:hypothetical protein
MSIKYTKLLSNIPNVNTVHIPTSSIARHSKIFSNRDFRFENIPSGNPAGRGLEEGGREGGGDSRIPGIDFFRQMDRRSPRYRQKNPLSHVLENDGNIPGIFYFNFFSEFFFSSFSQFHRPLLRTQFSENLETFHQNKKKLCKKINLVIFADKWQRYESLFFGTNIMKQFLCHFCDFYHDRLCSI